MTEKLFKFPPLHPTNLNHPLPTAISGTTAVFGPRLSVDAFRTSQLLAAATLPRCWLCTPFIFVAKLIWTIVKTIFTYLFLFFYHLFHLLTCHLLKQVRPSLDLEAMKAPDSFIFGLLLSYQNRFPEKEIDAKMEPFNHLTSETNLFAVREKITNAICLMLLIGKTEVPEELWPEQIAAARESFIYIRGNFERLNSSDKKILCAPDYFSCSESSESLTLSEDGKAVFKIAKALFSPPTSPGTTNPLLDGLSGLINAYLAKLAIINNSSSG